MKFALNILFIKAIPFLSFELFLLRVTKKKKKKVFYISLCTDCSFFSSKQLPCAVSHMHWVTSHSPYAHNFDFQVTYENRLVLSHSHLLQIRRRLIAAPRRNCFNLSCFELSKLSCRTETACWIDISAGDTYSDVSSGNHQPVPENTAIVFDAIYLFQMGKRQKLCSSNVWFLVSMWCFILANQTKMEHTP